ncbi:hypothetical protein HispidOSU_023954, partial [Sigmodon hispidus]
AKTMHTKPACSISTWNGTRAVAVLEKVVGDLGGMNFIKNDMQCVSIRRKHAKIDAGKRRKASYTQTVERIFK